MFNISEISIKNFYWRFNLKSVAEKLKKNMLNTYIWDLWISLGFEPTLSFKF